VISAFVVAAAGTAIFVGRSARHPVPVIQLSLLRDRVFSSANATVLLAFAAFSIELLSVILWMQEHWHYSAIKTGLASSPGPAMVPIFAVVAETLALRTRIPVGRIAAVGIFLIGAGAILFATLLQDEPNYLTGFLPCWLVVGTGVGLAIPTVFSSATVDLPPEQTATGSAIISMAQQVGSVIGISALVAILGVASGGAGLHDFRIAWVVAAGIAVAALVSALGLTPGRVTSVARVGAEQPAGVQ
jgi:MFS family permease